MATNDAVVPEDDEILQDDRLDSALLRSDRAPGYGSSTNSVDAEQNVQQRNSILRKKFQLKKCVDKCLWRVFYTLCFITGQYINFKVLKKLRLPKSSSNEKTATAGKKFISVIALLPFALQVIVCVEYVATAFFVDGLTIENATLPKTITFYSSKNDCFLPEEHWKFTTAISISAIAAIFSYGLMTVFILILANVIQCASTYRSNKTGSTTQRSAEHSLEEEGSIDREQRSIEENSIEHGSKKGGCTEYTQNLWDSDLDPYNDEKESMSTTEMAYFFINYLVVLSLFLCSLVASLYYASTVHNYCWMTAVYLTMIVLQLVSHFSAIQSCFIFSKIVYKITKKLETVADKMCKTDENMITVHYYRSSVHNLHQTNTGHDSPQNSTVTSCAVPCLVCKERVDKQNFQELQRIDKEFINRVKPTLHLFGVWFIFHWTLYALTTVLLSAFIIEIIIEILQKDLSTAHVYLPDGEADIRAPYVLYVIFFTLVHGYLFLYPCFRAAAIATARAKMINKISDKEWDNISVSIQTSFVQYLTSKNFAFQVPLFCASIPIGFNWVFVSFFVPILGVYLAL